ncbi:MAG TPA: transposase [bacterium]
MSQGDDDLPHRKITRLPWYDYAGRGGYSVTICTWQRAELFGKIYDGKMLMSREGEIAASDWLQIPTHYPKIVLNVFVIMPNHMHGILFLPQAEYDEALRIGPDTASRVPTRTFGPLHPCSLHTIVGNYKAGVTRKIRATVNQPIIVWQSRFHEHIIRDEVDLSNHQQYIKNNPSNWERDKHNPDFVE